jgi:predicted aspartyl protease
VITGTINEDLEPLLDDIFIKSKDQWVPIQTLLDTGFNGAFCLPRKYANTVELEPVGEIAVELGDGKVIITQVYLGNILVNNQPYLVELTITESESALMGMEMLLEKEAIFDLKTMTVRVI